MRCCLCGRAMWKASYFIGSEPVGDTCAKRAGLDKLAKKTGGKVRKAGAPVKIAKPDNRTMDLFEGME